MFSVNCSTTLAVYADCLAIRPGDEARVDDPIPETVNSSIPLSEDLDLGLVETLGMYVRAGGNVHQPPDATENRARQAVADREREVGDRLTDPFAVRSSMRGRWL